MKPFKFIALLVSILLLQAWPSKLEVSAVSYGDPVELPGIEFPEVVALAVDESSLCTGTLITQRIVLTAAHCVYGAEESIVVSVGGDSLFAGVLIPAVDYWYHPRYDERFKQNDIALVMLKTGAGVPKTASLPQSRNTRGSKFTIVGWGRDQNGRLTGRLSRLDLNKSDAAAKRLYRSYFNERTMIAAGRYFPEEVLYGGGCTGDSGGPLYRARSRVVIGITSFGASSCTTIRPTIFTKVGYYLNDIQRGITLLEERARRKPAGSPQQAEPRKPNTLSAGTPPLSLSCNVDETGYYKLYGGFHAICETSLGSGEEYGKNGSPMLQKVCTQVGGKVPRLSTPADVKNGTQFNYEVNPPYTAGEGCYNYAYSKSSSFSLIVLGFGGVWIPAEISVHDNYGRQAYFQFYICEGHCTSEWNR